MSICLSRSQEKSDKKSRAAFREAPERDPRADERAGVITRGESRRHYPTINIYASNSSPLSSPLPWPGSSSIPPAATVEASDSLACTPPPCLGVPGGEGREQLAKRTRPLLSPSPSPSTPQKLIALMA